LLTYVTSRVLQTVPVLFLASVLVFLVLRLIPGDPAAVMAGENATAEQIEAIRRQIGLTEPLPQQYLHWLSDLLHGDLGMSFVTHQSVSHLLAIDLPPTLELVAVAYPLALLIGVPFGVQAGVSPRSRSDWLLSVYTMFTLGIPSFLMGILLLYVFSVQLGWFPSNGRVAFLDDPLNSLRHVALPAVALGSVLGAVLARYTRTAVMSIMGQDFIRTAHAKGLSKNEVVYVHALRAALIPVVTIIALQLGNILAGAFVVEQLFTRPGLGRLLVDAIQGRDYIVVQSTLIVLVVIFVVVNLAADIAYAFLDPRIRYG
jgi:peptide/nickel transport system permease protein